MTPHTGDDALRVLADQCDRDAATIEANVKNLVHLPGMPDCKVHPFIAETQKAISFGVRTLLHCRAAEYRLELEQRNEREDDLSWWDKLGRFLGPKGRLVVLFLAITAIAHGWRIPGWIEKHKEAILQAEKSHQP